jgi:hypothetical protein
MLTSPLTRFFEQLFPVAREAEKDWRRGRSPRAALRDPQKKSIQSKFHVRVPKRVAASFVIEASIMSVHYFSMSVHYLFGVSCWTAMLQEKEGNMFGKSKGHAAEEDRDIESAQELQRSTATPGASEAISSISSGLLIVGKIVGHGAVTIFGHVEGELHASTVVIAEGGKVEGDIVARN